MDLATGFRSMCPQKCVVFVFVSVFCYMHIYVFCFLRVLLFVSMSLGLFVACVFDIFVFLVYFKACVWLLRFFICVFAIGGEFSDFCVLSLLCVFACFCHLSVWQSCIIFCFLQFCHPCFVIYVFCLLHKHTTQGHVHTDTHTHTHKRFFSAHRFLVSCFHKFADRATDFAFCLIPRTSPKKKISFICRVLIFNIHNVSAIMLKRISISSSHLLSPQAHCLLS